MEPEISSPNVTLRDVARRAGVSVTTVSLVLNDAPLARYIPAITKDAVKLAARELGYRPNPFARSLRSRRSHTVGVMVFDITDPYCTQILRGIENRLYESSYLAVVTDIRNDRQRFERYLEMLLERRVEGLLTVANSLSLETELLSVFAERQVPTVILGRQVDAPGVSSVVVDNQAGARLALQYLVQLGHRRIAFLRGPGLLVDSRQRWDGIVALAGEAGLELDHRLIVELEDPARCYEEGYARTGELLRQELAFTALLAFDDMSAFGAIRALSEAGRQVPRDCSVIGFDDVATAGLYNPPLSTVRQPMERLGMLGVEILVKAVNASLKHRPFTPQHHCVLPDLVTRLSTAPPRPPRRRQ